MRRLDRASLLTIVPRNRRGTAIAWLLLLTLATTMLGPAGASIPADTAPRAAPPGEAQQPDVVVIVTDDQRTDSLRRMRTVSSELVGKGRLFTFAGVPTSLCCPSRASILTGLFAHSTRIYSNAYPTGGSRRFRDRGLEERTLATLLSEAGYRTGLVGKYLNGFANHAPDGYVPPGWDSFVTFASEMGYYDYTLTDGTRHGERPADYSTDVLARYAHRFITSTNADTPLFLYFAPWAPHDPFTPAPRHAGYWTARMPSYDGPWVDENLSDKPAWVQGREPRPQRDIAQDLAGIQDSLMAVDDAVGRVLAALQDAGRLDDTLLIYLSDQGTAVGEHHLKIWKNLPYRFTTEIPLVVRWDNAVPAGSKDAGRGTPWKPPSGSTVTAPRTIPPTAGSVLTGGCSRTTRTGPRSCTTTGPTRTNCTTMPGRSASRTSSRRCAAMPAAPATRCHPGSPGPFRLVTDKSQDGPAHGSDEGLGRANRVNSSAVQWTRP